MDLKDKNVGFCLTGSFCTFKNTILQMKELIKARANILPIMSKIAYKTDTKFGKANDFIKQIEEISLSFTDIYLEGLSIFLKKKNNFKNNEEQEIVNLEVKKIEGVLQLIKQDRKELYLKRKIEKSKIQQEILQNEEPKQSDEALEKYFEELDKEIQKYIDD